MSFFPNKPDVVGLFRRLPSVLGSRMKERRRHWKRNKTVRRHLEALASSPLFDGRWYLSRYPDVSAAGTDPAVHYLANGWREGRDPGPHFSTTAYLEANADVAASGKNPLLHFLEYGLTEGRGALHHYPSDPQPLPRSEPFGEAASCLELAFEKRSPLRWCRAAQLNRERLDAILISGEPIGYRGAGSDAAFKHFKVLAQLSGVTPAAAELAQVEPAFVRLRLVDAWYSTAASLRTRWYVDETPSVVRAYQHDALAGGTLCLIGEEGIAGKTAFVDFRLVNPYYPLLFIQADLAGSVIGSWLLGFPSLCRGGAHYPELLADACNRPLDPFRYSAELVAGLLDVQGGRTEPAIKSLSCDLTGADGGGPMFQPDFQAWLRNVIRVPLAPQRETAECTTQHLEANISVSVQDARAAGGELVLSGDMVPSIHILQSTAGSAGTISGSLPMPIIVARPDVSQPALLFDPTSIYIPQVVRPSQGITPTWPFITLAGGGRAPDGRQPAAIRVSRRVPLEDTQRLFPSLSVQKQRREQAISWLIDVKGWSQMALIEAIQSLLLQEGASNDVLALAGHLNTATAELCARFFPERVIVESSIVAAAEACTTPLIGYLGNSLRLHDPRCSSILAEMAQEAEVASASCMIVHAEQRGRGWSVRVTDAGTVKTCQAGPTPARWADLIWGATFPTLRPPAGFWIARRDAVMHWLAAGRLPSGQVHLCTSLVTVSALEPQAFREAVFRPPQARGGSLHISVMFG